MKAGDRFNLMVIQEKIKNAKAYLKTHRKKVHSLLLQLFLWTSVLCLIQLFYLRQDLELCSQKTRKHIMMSRMRRVTMLTRCYTQGT